MEFIRPQNPRGKLQKYVLHIGHDRPLISEYFNMVLRSRHARFGDGRKERDKK